MGRNESFLQFTAALCLLWAAFCCQMICDIHAFASFNNTGAVQCWPSPIRGSLNQSSVHLPRPPCIDVNSLAFGGRGCYFSTRRKKFGKGIFDATLGYPGEGPGEETQGPTKGRRRKILQRRVGHININETENDVWVQIKDTFNVDELAIAINEEVTSGQNRAGVLRALHRRHTELTQAQRTLLKTINLSQSQRLIASQVRHSGNIAELKQALTEETQHANRASVLQLLRARIGQVQAAKGCPSRRYADFMRVQVQVIIIVVVAFRPGDFDMRARFKDIQAAVRAMGDAPQHVFESALNKERAGQKRKAVIALLNRRIRKAAKGCPSSRYADFMRVQVQVIIVVVVVFRPGDLDMRAGFKDIQAAVKAMGDAPQHVFETALMEERAGQKRKVVIELLNRRIRKVAKLPILSDCHKGRGGILRDFFWSNRGCSAMHCAANFAMEAASSVHWSDEDIAAWCTPVEEKDVVAVARAFLEKCACRSDARVCGVCGIVGLEGQGREVPIANLAMHAVGGINDDSSWSRIRRLVRDGVISQEAGKMRQSMLHTTVIAGKRLRLFEGAINGLYCMMCAKCRQQHQQIWRWQKAGKTVLLSRLVTEPTWSGYRKQCVTVPPPANSFSSWDPGRIESIPKLSLMEKTAIAVYVVASCIHKVQKAPDDFAKWRIRGHTIVFLTNAAKVLLTRVRGIFLCDVTRQTSI